MNFNRKAYTRLIISPERDKLILYISNKHCIQHQTRLTTRYDYWLLLSNSSAREQLGFYQLGPEFHNVYNLSLPRIGERDRHQFW